MIVNRNLAIDYTKTFAIMAVIFCHVYPSDYFENNMIVLGVLRMTGVPLFLMCTGALMLNRDLDSYESVKKFYCKNLFSLLVTSWIWYLIYMFVTQYEVFSVNLLSKTLFFINKPTVHLWYLRMILVYYAFIPLMIILRKKWCVLYYVFVFFAVGLVFLKTTIMLFEGTEYPTVSGFSMLVYWGYMEFGRWIYDHNRGKSSFITWLILFMAIISYIILCIFVFTKEHLFLWYDNVCVAGISAGLFLLFKQIASICKMDVITRFAKQTFGIYLIHVIWLNLVWKLFLCDAELCNLLKIITEFIVAILISSLCVTLVGRCRVLARFLFRI